MTELEKARLLLESGGYTCVISAGGEVHTSTLRGVAPILALIEDGVELRGGCAADKVIGKAAAMLLVHAGVTSVYGAVMSEAAQEFLLGAGVETSCGELCERIMNRTKDGFCPMEQAVWQLTDPKEALAAVRRRLDELNKENTR